MPVNDTAWLLDALEDPGNGWSIGTFGAIAEFVRDPNEASELRRREASLSVSTDRGALRLVAEGSVVPLAYETPNGDGETWSQSVALCLPAGTAAMHRRTVLTELGPDDGAVRTIDRPSILFDVGLGALQADICIRTDDAVLLDVLRGVAGRSVFEPGNPAMPAIIDAGPHRVVLCRFGRAEVFQPIPPADGASPEGPHTHVLPALLRSGRTHAATTPIPEGLVPCAHLFPASPVRDQFGRRRTFDPQAFGAFQSLFLRWGEPNAKQLKRAVWDALDTGVLPEEFEAPDWRHARATIRTAIRQALHSRDGRDLTRAWSRFFDRGPDTSGGDEQPAH